MARGNRWQSRAESPPFRGGSCRYSATTPQGFSSTHPPPQPSSSRQPVIHIIHIIHNVSLPSPRTPLPSTTTMLIHKTYLTSRRRREGRELRAWGHDPGTRRQNIPTARPSAQLSSMLGGHRVNRCGMLHGIVDGSGMFVRR